MRLLKSVLFLLPTLAFVFPAFPGSAEAHAAFTGNPSIQTPSPLSGDSYVNQSEYYSGFTLRVLLTGTGAEAGDVLELLLSNGAFATSTLTAGDITNVYEDFTISSTTNSLGAEGLNKQITARITDGTDSLNIATSSALSFTLDLAPTVATRADVSTVSSSTPVVVTYTNPTATDTLSSGLGVSCTPASGSSFGVGTTTVSCSTTDDASNSASSSFSVGVVLDNTAATFSNVSIASNNASTTLAKVGDVVTLSFTASEAINTPTVTIGAHSGSEVNLLNTSGLIWNASTTLTSSDGTGALTFTINATDTVGNTSSAVSAISTGSPVVLDKTAPGNPTANPSSGEYGSAVSVTFTSANASFIRYSTSGNPTCSSGTLFSSAVSVSATTNFNVVGCDDAGNISDRVTFNYGIFGSSENNSSSSSNTNTSAGGGGGGGGGSAISSSPAAQISAPQGTISSPGSAPSQGAVGEVLGASTYNFRQTLALGSRGSEVSELQKTLIAEGVLKSQPTGYFGQLTKDAVTAYQKKYGLDPIGIVGPKTRTILNRVKSSLTPSVNKAVGGADAMVQELSRKLIDLIKQLQALQAQQPR